MEKKDWVHLGDGVYLASDGNGIVLRANSHVEPTDEIYLEREVMDAIILIYNKLIN